MHLFIQREVCFLSALKEGNTFTAACVILSVITKQDVLVEPTVTFRGDAILELSSIALFPVSLTLFISQNVLPSFVFAFSCCGVFSCFAGPTAGVSMLSTPKSSTTSWKQQAVRMTSSCHKVFYVSVRALTLSTLLSTTASQHSLFCDITF